MQVGTEADRVRACYTRPRTMAITSTQSAAALRTYAILTALDSAPLTGRQLLRLSHTWDVPFHSLRRTFECMKRLCDLRVCRAFRYAALYPGQPENYYVLSPAGYRLLYGPDAPPPPRGYCSALALARQPHSRVLADVIVHSQLLLHDAGGHMADFARENTLRLAVDDETLYPDAAFTARIADDTYRFYLEVDMGTERLRSQRTDDTLQRKLRFYDRLQNRIDTRFRVLFLLGGNSVQRRDAILDMAATLTSNHARTLVYATTHAAFMAATDAAQPIFFDHRQDRHGLLPHRREAAAASPRWLPTQLAA